MCLKMSTGFLITNLSGKFRTITDIVNQHVMKKLYIYVSVNKNYGENVESISKRIVNMYSLSLQVFPNLDVRIILNDLKKKSLLNIKDYNVDVIILPTNYDQKILLSEAHKKDLSVIYVEALSDSDEKNFTSQQGTKGQSNIYNNVVVGGTFDRLHTGHKILLSEALLRCSEKLTVGVTDGEMILGKKLWELIEPCENRVTAVRTFISEVDPSVTPEVVPITDMYGPTRYDPNLDLIVVSSETQSGAHKVNDVRRESKLKELSIHVVNLAEDLTRNNNEEQKISSSNIRMRLLGTHIKAPKPKPELLPKPYIIGLTGGAASGKSTICEKLKSLGAGVIDCDKIAHHLYEPQTKLFREVVEAFGDQIVSQDGSINRKVLGSIVFGNPEKLEKLNNLMWPAILQATIEECKRLYAEEKKQVVVLEAAVLIKAGWHDNVHEVWAVIIPPKEAVQRLMKRNNLSEQDAELRVKAQPPNTELVKYANVVLCSLWSEEYTQQQVIKAWDEMQKIRNS